MSMNKTSPKKIVDHSSFNIACCPASTTHYILIDCLAPHKIKKAVRATWPAPSFGTSERPWHRLQALPFLPCSTQPGPTGHTGVPQSPLAVSNMPPTRTAPSQSCTLPSATGTLRAVCLRLGSEAPRPFILPGGSLLYVGGSPY